MKFRAALAFFLAIVVIGSPVYAGALPVSTGQYLSTAFQDDALKFQNEKISLLRGAPSAFPLFNEVEFRMKIDEFEADKQQYAVRLKPNGWGEAENSRKVHDQTVQFNETHYDYLVHQALKDRYDLIIDYLHSRRIISLNEELMAVYEDRVRVLRQSVDTVNFNPDDLLNAENNVIRLEMDAIALRNDLLAMEGEILRHLPKADASLSGASLPNTFLIDTAGTIAIPAMKSIIAQADLSKGLNEGLNEDRNIHLEHSLRDAALSRAEYELEKTENSRYFSFIEAAYDTDDQDDFEKAFSLQFGISIPLGNSAQKDVHRKKLSSLQAESEHMLRQKEIREDSVLLLTEVNRLIAQHNALNAKKTRNKTRESFDAYRRMDGVNPLILLKLKESLLKTDIAVQKINRRIYEKYIRFLDVSGKLSEKPYRNYLSADLEPIRP